MTDVCSLEKKPLLTVADALQRIHAEIQAIENTETLSLSEALGRVLAEPVYSPINLPPERNAAMDGYAFASDDIKQSKCLTVVGTSWAGKPFTGSMQAGQCVRIFTGAVLPKNTDSVVMQEQVQRKGDTVDLPENIKIKQNVRAVGEDVAQGELLLNSKKLSAVDLALLATAGIAQIKVRRRLKIAICSTGDELVALGQPLASGQIYDSNRYLLQGLLNDECYQLTDLGVIVDDKEQIKQQFLEAAAKHDVLISTGGASVGEADYIKQVLDECGTVNFWKLAIKPGKPLTFGKINACYFFGLPGNPVSAQVTFQTVVSPALQQLSGATVKQRLQLTATCLSPLKKSAGRQEFQRGILRQQNGELVVESSGKQGSNLLKALSLANCYIILPSECAGIKIGDKVIVEPFNMYF
ncbi:molybdopterin molybdotransferase [Patescibacteria group bacterium]|nr:molybdopterin molybdotransferase [Patescibacteria group bacterium]